MDFVHPKIVPLLNILMLLVSLETAGADAGSQRKPAEENGRETKRCKPAGGQKTPRRHQQCGQQAGG